MDEKNLSQEEWLEELLSASQIQQEPTVLSQGDTKALPSIPKDKSVEEDELERLQQGMFVSVVSLRRTARTISNVYSAKGYLMGPETAMAYAGLQDYRATAGEGRLALILARRRPVDDVEAVAAAIGMDPAALKARLD